MKSIREDTTVPKSDISDKITNGNVDRDISVWIELTKKEIGPLFWRGTSTNSPIGDWTGDDVPILDKVTDIVNENIRSYDIPKRYAFKVELTTKDVRYLRTRLKDEWTGKFKPILDKLTEAVNNKCEDTDVNDNDINNKNSNLEEDILIKNIKNAIEQLIPWIYVQIKKSSDKYIRMRLSDIKKDIGEIFENVNDADLYWGLKQILFDLDIVVDSLIHKDGTEVIKMRMKTGKDVQPIKGKIWTYDKKKAAERYENYSKFPILTEYIERKEKVKKYDGGKIVTIRSFVINKDHRDETEETRTFTAVLKNGKIGIILDDESNEDHLFCDFLRNEFELKLFFNEAHNDFVCFTTNEIINDVERCINFSDGLWTPSDDDIDALGNELANSRDELIQLCTKPNI